MARLLQRIVEPPHRCSYLGDREAQLDVRLMLDVSPAEWSALLARGWRRFGAVYFRPLCAGCGECVSLRIDVARFVASRNQRRAKNRCARLRRVVSRPLVTEERLALYHRWHQGREQARGWDASRINAERYAFEFALPHACAHEAAFYDDEAGAEGGRLVGLGLYDEVPDGLSAIYFFHDPAYESLSLGTANIVALVDEAARTGQPWVYLGYCVSGCASLAYKARFTPHQRLVGRPALDEEPCWI